ncbi:MAG: nicotinamide-nucleotide amidase [Candidatus Competibacteraceae bacterium]|nr:nicotinamide-nucleotide amidase [Candidatus Competibacteraceae bacterium]MCP5125311.1 nicotinamide-nucleotide amidase [Gammaproteobacteria bacterium]HRX71772.1 nicotinamide-nucleotide amidase [Candidatus Competibacteraceae bacterium]
MSITNPTDQNLYELATQVGNALRARKQKLALAESCTGGWIGKVITDVAGSSHWFDCGFVTYSNTAKSEILGVQEATLAHYSAVSAETVIEMAMRTLSRSRADVAVAVSGIAGPDGGSPQKPVGTVYLAWALRSGSIQTQVCHFAGDREAVRRQTVAMALQGVLEGIDP